MKKGGVKLTTPKDTVVFQRGDNVLAFNIQGLASMDEFDQLVHKPEPPTVTKRGGVSYKDEKDPTYLAAMDELNELRVAYIVVKSLEGDDIEWETVDAKKPDTWHLWQTELQEAGLTVFERNFLLAKILEVNGIGSQEIYAKVRDNFLANQQEKTSQLQ